MVRLWPLAALALLAVFCGWQGYQRGAADCAAAHRAEQLARIEAGRMLEDARRQIAHERDQLSRKLEEQAYAEPVAVERCLGPDRVRRLNAIR
ncbi:hypothetical protein [Leisingera sp. M523]|uniref:hypothetical protein n=1 Tax=Leisingera sp. M523 TaxID=2867013 RepID=UPI0021A26381|nr:hypothetical protein [Leisingera sp. M523]UWQ29923.1 hypothetical protein K3557_05075 [Leisingera sp. M523]